MIVPEFSPDLFELDIDEVVRRIKNAGLFGTVAFAGVTGDHLAKIEQAVLLTSGCIDLHLALDGVTPENALELLNNGVSTISVDDRSAFADIPDNRVIDMTGNESGFVRPDTISEDALSSHLKSGDNVLVPAAFFESETELITHSICRTLTTDRADGLWPTILVDPAGIALGLAYSSEDSLLHAIRSREGTYWSRSRNELWVKGKSSGATQRLIRIDIDCDSDCLRFTVDQKPPGFCHRNTPTCFGSIRSIQTVLHRLQSRLQSTDQSSYTRRLADDPGKLRAKLLEEAEELSDASSPEEICWEAADVLYFSLIKMLASGVSLADVFHELARRTNRIIRRPEKQKNADSNSPS